MHSATPESIRRWGSVLMRREANWSQSFQRATLLTTGLPPARSSWHTSRASFWSLQGVLWKTNLFKGDSKYLSTILWHWTSDTTTYAWLHMRTRQCVFLTESSMKKSSILSTLTSAVPCATLNSPSRKMKNKTLHQRSNFRNMIFCPVPGRIIGPSPV